MGILLTPAQVAFNCELGALFAPLSGCPYRDEIC
jgi:hypothetical protein